MNTQNVRYCNALDENGQLVSIKEAWNVNEKFICPSCKSEMIKKCGQYKAWHFAHKNKQCDYDKYLHTVAEQRIMKWFNESEKVMIIIHSFSKCPMYNQCRWTNLDDCRHNVFESYNLKQWFGCAELEKTLVKDGEKYVADIYCHSRKEDIGPLFLEICVTHRCEQEKIKSGIKIIEFDIKSEADIDTIIGSPIRENEFTHLYNFHPKDTISNTPDLRALIQKFILYPSMKAYVDYFICHDIDKRRGVYEISIEYNDCISPFSFDGGFYAVAMAMASEKFQIKNCSLCKYQTYDLWENLPICLLYKKYGTNKNCGENNPVECSYFRKDEIAIRQRIKAFNKYKESHPVDVWIRKEQ